MFFFQAEDGIRDSVASRGLGDVYKRQLLTQDWVMDPKLKVKDVLTKVDSKSLNIKDFIRIKIGE